MASSRGPCSRHGRNDADHQHRPGHNRGGGTAMRVVIAEDSIFCNSIAEMLSAGGHEVSYAARTGEELLASLNRSGPPDVAVLDIRMPRTNTDEGLVTAERIRNR